MFKLFVLAAIIVMGIYYVDIIGKLIKDDRHGGPPKYSGCKAMLPFAYWIAPLKEKKKRRKEKVSKVKSKKPKTNEKK